MGTVIISSSIASAVTLTDIGEHWAKPAIEKLVEEKVINGYPDETFRPDNPIKREEAAKMVSAYFDMLIKSKGIVKTYTDVNSEMWSEPYITDLSSAGIIDGYADGSFKPGNNIKRAEASKLIFAALDNTNKYNDLGNTASLTDIEGHWAKGSIEKLVSMGAINGYPGGVFKPENDISRAELAKILYSLTIPYNERTYETTDVNVKNLPEAYGVQLNDSEITDGSAGRDKLNSHILEGVTATDENGNAVSDIYIEDDYVNSTVEGEYQVTVVFKTTDGKRAKKKVKVIVADYEWEKIDDMSVRIKSSNSSMATLALPRYIEGIRVKELGKDAFKNSTTLKKVYIPQECHIGNSGFYGSTLEEVVFIDSYSPETIGEWSFGSTELTEVVLPGSLKSIAPHSFRGCMSLLKVNIPNSVTSIGENAFSGSPLLKTVVIPSSVTSIDRFAFSACSALSEIVIPNSVKEIKSHAFFGSGLKSITVPNSVELMEDGVFRSCQNLSSAKILSPITVIPSYTFSNCASLEEVEIPNHVVNIKERAFANCESLKTIDLPNSLIVVGPLSFGESGLEEVNIPSSVETIAVYAFKKTPLNTLRFEGGSKLKKIGELSFKECNLNGEVRIPGSIKKY